MKHPYSTAAHPGLFPVLILLMLQLLPGMTVGTYNIRYDTGGDAAEGNEWSRRAPVVAGLIRFHDFDVLCTQEALPNQMKDMKDLLPEHTVVSYGRDDGAGLGEHMGIFFPDGNVRCSGVGQVLVVRESR